MPAFRPSIKTWTGKLAALRAAGCAKIFHEKASGKALDGRPELERAIQALGPGDVLVLAEWDRATRSMFDGVAIIQRVSARGALIKVLDKTSDIGQGILAFLSALASDERKRIVRRANEGRAAAKANGRKFGRKPKLNKHQMARAREKIAAGVSYREIARQENSSHMTIARLAKD